MKLKEVWKVLSWLGLHFQDNFNFEKTEVGDGLTKVEISICDSEYGWESDSMYFNKEGDYINEYGKQLEIKRQIKQLQEELKKIQNL